MPKNGHDHVFCMYKNGHDHVFCMYKGGNPKVFKSKFKQIEGLCSSSPAENKFDLEMAYEVFFFSDSCRFDLVNKESN